MTKENTLAVNPLPSPTWNRLHMNETTVTLPPLDGPCKADWSGAEVTTAPAPATVVSTGMGQEAEAAFASLETDRITAKANTDTTARLTLCADGAKNARRVELTAEANSHLTVVMDLQSTADAPLPGPGDPGRTGPRCQSATGAAEPAGHGLHGGQ